MKMGLHRNLFHIADYAVCFLLLLISVCIGLYYGLSGGKQKTTSEFLMGDRQMKVVPIALSLLATFTSTISLLGDAAEMYVHGTQFWLYMVATVIGSIITAVLIVPMLYPLKLISIYEYFELRFHSKILRVLCSCLSLIGQLLIGGLTLFGASIAFSAVTPVPAWVVKLTLGIVCTFYTGLGGMKAVVWTDVFQAMIILSGLLAVVIQGSMEVGSLSRVWEVNEKWGRIEFTNFDPDPTRRTSVWSTTIVLSLLVLCQFTTQSSVQRFSSLPSMTGAKKALILNGPGCVILGSLTCLAGVVAFGYYAAKGCDPLRIGYIKNRNQILPYFASDVLLYPGLPGLFMACLLGGTLSTLSSLINASAALVWDDMLKERWSHLSEETATRVTKFIVCLSGALSIITAFMAAEIGGTLAQITILFVGATMGPIVGLIFLGGMFPRVNWKAALIGAVAGIALFLWVSVGASLLKLHNEALPSPIDGCTFGNNSRQINSTSRVYTNSSFIRVNSWDLKHSFPLEARGHAENETEVTITGVNRLYTISHLWYHVVGMGGTVVVSLLLSFLPGMKETNPLHDSVIFPLVLSMLRKLGFRSQAVPLGEIRTTVKDRAKGPVIETSNGQECVVISLTDHNTNV